MSEVKKSTLKTNKIKNKDINNHNNNNNQFYRNSAVGISLTTSLNEMIENNEINSEAALLIMVIFYLFIYFFYFFLINCEYCIIFQ